MSLLDEMWIWTRSYGHHSPIPSLRESLRWFANVRAWKYSSRRRRNPAPLVSPNPLSLPISRFCACFCAANVHDLNGTYHTQFMGAEIGNTTGRWRPGCRRIGSRLRGVGRRCPMERW